MYRFLDHDDDNCLELSIEGKDYAKLIETCFEYSAYFSFNIGFLRRNGIESNIPKPYKVYEQYRHLAICDDIAVIECSEAAKQYLLHNVNELFEWIDWHKNPEDLTFYRHDGSIFFWSLIHEGVCCIVERDDEDVSGVVKNHGWVELSQDTHDPFFVPYGLASFVFEPIKKFR